MVIDQFIALLKAPKIFLSAQRTSESVLVIDNTSSKTISEARFLNLTTVTNIQLILVWDFGNYFIQHIYYDIVSLTTSFTGSTIRQPPCY